MKVIIFGATGMVGAGALLECFADSRVEQVLAVARKPTGIRHAKLEEVLHADFYDYADLQARWPAEGYPSRVLEGRDINASGASPHR